MFHDQDGLFPSSGSFHQILFVTETFPLIWSQEPDKPVKTLEEDQEENMKEYKDYLLLEESILKDAGLLPARA